MKPCNHTPPKPGCRLCWLFEHDTRYRQLWGGDPATVTAPVAQAPVAFEPTPEQKAQLEQIKRVIRLPCVHLGVALEEKPSCGCGGKSALLHVCAKFGQCRPYAPRQTEARQCVGCERYSPELAP